MNAKSALLGRIKRTWEENELQEMTIPDTVVSRKGVLKKHKSVRDNAERHDGKLSV